MMSIIQTIISPRLLFSSLCYRSPFLQVTVVRNEVGGALDVVLNLGAGLRRKALHEGDDLVNIVDALEVHEVGGEAGNVGRSYYRC